MGGHLGSGTRLMAIGIQSGTLKTDAPRPTTEWYGAC